MEGETYERYISSYICEEVGRLVHWAQRAYDSGGDSSDSFAPGCRNRRQRIGRLAARFQRMRPSGVCLAHAKQRGGFFWELLLGILYIFIGVYLLVHPLAGLASLTIALAIYLFLEAILEFVLGFTLRPLPGSGWLLFDGIVTLVLAVMIWRTWPSSTAWVIGTLVGISMLFSGTSRLMLSLAARSATSKLA